MDHRPMTSSVPRALRLGLVVTLAVSSMFVSTGCHKRRTAMRPVIISPSESVGVVPSATCDTEPGLSAAPSVELQRPLTDPGFTPSSGAEVERRPVGPSPKSGAGRAYSPPVPDTLAEPELTLPDPPKSRRNGGTGNGTGGLMPELSPPDAPKSTSNTARPTSALRVRQASSLREVVRPYVNDPEDLFAPPKADRPWKYVVIHHSANATGSYAQIDREHRKIQGWNGCGYHFVIGNGSDSPDGEIEVARRWADQKQGLHCRNGKFADINEYGVGICLIGDFDKSEPTPKQLAAVKAVTAYLAERYRIPADKIGTHGQMATGHTACPGENFPVEDVLGRTGFAAK